METRKQKRFRKLYEQVHEQFERFCRARVYGDMDYRELMNETLLVAWDKLDTLRDEQAFLGFLFGVREVDYVGSTDSYISSFAILLVAEPVGADSGAHGGDLYEKAGQVL